MILAIDQGTTGTTCLVFDGDGRIRGRAYSEFRQHFPRPGWVEHDANEIWAVTKRVASHALADAKADPGSLDAIGITNQRETVVAWDPVGGEPVHNALVWQDRRTAGRCDELREAGYEELVRERTGLVLDPYFSGTKIEWLLANVEKARDAVFGTIDSWLVFKLTGRHATDFTNASRTMLFDIEAAALGCGAVRPARRRPSAPARAAAFGRGLRHHLGVRRRGPGRRDRGRPAGGALRPGLRAARDGEEHLRDGQLRAPERGWRGPPAERGPADDGGWGIADEVTYALEAAVFVTGAAVQWLRDGLGLVAEAAETERMAASLQSNDDVYFVPALTGLGSPHWDAYARGTIVGLTRGTTRAHLARAALEGIAYQTVDAVRAQEQAAGEQLSELRADGGAVANRWLMQFQADVLGAPVIVPEIAETTALGAAYLAGIGAGTWSAEEVSGMWREAARYEPALDRDERARLLGRWSEAVARAKGWAEPESQ